MKYLGIYLDCHLNWHTHENITSSKLSRAVGMLCKIRHFVKHETLKMIYYGMFSSILTCCSQIWGQNNNIVNKLQILQNKALRRINFQSNQASASVLYKNCKILKLRDHVNLQNFLFAHDSIKNNLPNSLRDQVCLVNNSTHTRSITFHQLQRPPNKTIVYGSNSIKSKSVDIWNYINHEAHQEKLHEKSRVFCKSFVKNFLINRY